MKIAHLLIAVAICFLLVGGTVDAGHRHYTVCTPHVSVHVGHGYHGHCGIGHRPWLFPRLYIRHHRLHHGHTTCAPPTCLPPGHPPVCCGQPLPPGHPPICHCPGTTCAPDKPHHKKPKTKKAPRKKAKVKVDVQVGGKAPVEE